MHCLLWQIYEEEGHRSFDFYIFERVGRRRLDRVDMDLLQPIWIQCKSKDNYIINQVSHTIIKH